MNPIQRALRNRRACIDTVPPWYVRLYRWVLLRGWRD